ncbi:hypothetical protein NG895_19500 [Aeoliella sp. ICT_H6.2]|uniref:Carboxypeptidase regulatory-like domain-containing protein n=2 Tax=Aeoliella straminimaris TaxID=2954799 RepID=A0A9X2JHR2_9BACT|nr:hypothetical protein [Aeoliella straminimaris]
MLLAMLLVAATGCGDARPPTYPASGVVRFEDGTPVRYGVVNLVPQSAGPSARGKINSRGEFELGTFDTTDGAMAGEYRVLIVQYLPSAEKVVAAPDEHEHSDSSIVPLSYSQLDHTPLRAEIVTDGDNRLEMLIERPGRSSQ